jgi:hypothetical protein
MFKFLKHFSENISLQQRLKFAEMGLDSVQIDLKTYRDIADKLKEKNDSYSVRIKELEQKNKIYEELILKFNLREKGHEID